MVAKGAESVMGKLESKLVRKVARYILAFGEFRFASMKTVYRIVVVVKAVRCVE